jgi:hypothetical protein
MRPETRRLIHIGINFLLVPAPVVSQTTGIAFQNALIQRSIEFDRVSYEEDVLKIIRERLPLQIVVKSPTGQPAGQLLILAPQPARNLDYFTQEAEFVVEAFESTWAEQRRQIVRRDVTIRHLYETNQHAFQEIWETRLGQPESSLAVFGRRVLGGGLRFVMPPQPHDDNPAQIEVKIESYLRDTSKVFVETQFTWPGPTPPDVSFAPRDRLSEVNDYATNEVLNFIQGEE